MTDSLMPLDKFLVARLQENSGDYKMNGPRLGVAGQARIGAEVPMHYVGRSMSAQEFKQYDESVRWLGRQSTTQHLIEIVRLNFGEYQAAIRRFSAEYKADHVINWGRVREIVIELNRHILNFLTSMKTFLDHTQTRLDRTFGKTSKEFTDYKDAEHLAFDTHFSYRFICKLRNFTQHCGMPLGHVNANAKLADAPSSASVSHEIDFYFEKAGLLSNFSEWGKHVEDELKKQSDLFPIGPHIQQTMLCLEDINSVVVRQSATGLRQHLAVLDGFIAELPGDLGTPCVFTALSADAKSNPGNTIVNMNLQRFHIQHLAAARQMLADATRASP